MSDPRVRAAVEQMEAWLDDSAWQPDPEVLARWDAEFRAAAAQAEKGDGWCELVERAHEAGRRLQAQDQGNRALKGYGASSR